MAQRGRGYTYSDQNVVRLVRDYVECPRCELTVPTYEGEDPLGMTMPGSLARCGLCKWVFPPGPRLPLELRDACPECAGTIRAPARAAFLACPGCGGWTFNPSLPPSVRARAEAILRDQNRIADLVDRFVVATDHDIPAPRGSSDPLPGAFADALAAAIRESSAPRQQRVLELRYGLDGTSGRTFRQIAALLDRSPARAREILDQGVRAIVAAARTADDDSQPRPLPSPRRACVTAVNLATAALGDPLDLQAPRRVRAFVDTALPRARPEVATDLLLRLSGWHTDLAPQGRDRALCRAVAAVGR